MPKTQDCHVCGSESAAVYKKAIPTDIKLKGFKKFTVECPSWECKSCGEIYGGKKENAVLYEKIAQEKAKQLANKVKASEITSLTLAAKMLHMSRQAVHKAVKKGQINYVLIGNQMCPIIKDIEHYAETRTA